MSEIRRKPHPGARSNERHDHDDEHGHHEENMGRLLSRREAVKLLGGTTVAIAAGGSLFAFAQGTPGAEATAELTAEATSDFPTCVAKPDLTEGPYFTDVRLDRSDIRSDPTTGAISEGLELHLNFVVTQIDGETCAPFENVMVDVWHCDASGVYSNFQGDDGTSAEGQYFLRGYQMTDAMGQANFITIYPGWYQGRSVHIHFKMRTDADSESGYEFTSQLFFDDELSDEVFTEAPYNEKTGDRLLNSEDGIYEQSGGQLMLDVVQDDDGIYTATFNIGLDLTAEPTNSNGPGGGGAGFGGGRPPRGTRPGATPTAGG